MSRKIDSYLDLDADARLPRGDAAPALPPRSYRVRPTACSSGGAMPPELLMRPRIPRAPKVPAFSLYPLLGASRRPPAPAPFLESAAPATLSWSALGRDLEPSATKADHRPSEPSGDAAPGSALARVQAYFGDPRAAANALGVGAAIGLIVASFMLFACK